MKLNNLDTDNLIRFKGLDPNFMIHPTDKDALDAIKQIPVLDIVLKKFLEYGFERFMYIQNIADNVRVSEKQCPRIYEMLTTACDVLEIEVPELYINQTPVANAYTSGVNKPYIVIHSGIVELLEDDEVYSVIAHELGHIKCNHVLYLTLARFLAHIITVIGQSTFGLGNLLGSGLIMMLLEWSRKAEFSADRAALLAVQNPDIITSVNMKMAGGCKAIYEQFDKEEFLKQADDYRELDKDTLSQIYKVLTIANMSHPHSILRAREAHDWAKTEAFQEALKGNYPKTDHYCNSCHQSFTETFKFCPNCGAKNEKAEASCQNCQAKDQAGNNFCSVCGTKLT
ncbi:MAG: M48 family metallopeptidase [Cyanobacteriota bacterium]